MYSLISQFFSKGMHSSTKVQRHLIKSQLVEHLFRKSIEQQGLDTNAGKQLSQAATDVYLNQALKK
jgi:hypothetical protein